MAALIPAMIFASLAFLMNKHFAPTAYGSLTFLHNLRHVFIVLDHLVSSARYNSPVISKLSKLSLRADSAFRYAISRKDSAWQW